MSRLNDRLTHLRVILQSGMIESREDPNTDKAPVGKINGGKRADILALKATDAVVAIGNLQHLSQQLESESVSIREALTVCQTSQGVEELSNVVCY